MCKRKKIVILNITHGDKPYYKHKDFLPIAAGGCRHDITSDADGEDNISYKNKWYGDFTSIYWAWKNLKGVDIVGTSHYRRYFVDEEYLPGGECSWQQFTEYRYSTNSLVSYLSKDVDIVLLESYEMTKTVREQYLSCHPFPFMYDLLFRVIEDCCPDYVVDFTQYFNSTTFTPGYLFVARWEVFDGICSWIYPILCKIEDNLKLEIFEGYQSRVIAFLYERLIPIYVIHNKLKVKEMNLFYIGQESKESPSFVRATISKKRFRHKYIHPMASIIKKYIL